MKDKEHELLMKMVVKIDEARTYNRISGVLTLIWFIEFFYTFFYTQNFDTFYWIIWIFCIVGFYHMNKKFRAAINEYEQLKKEYENNI